MSVQAINEVSILLEKLSGGKTRIVCHVEVNELDSTTKNPITVFRQESCVIETFKLNNYHLKVEIVFQIIELFKLILIDMERMWKNTNPAK